MTTRPLIVVVITLPIVLTALVVVGLRVLERDREALFVHYGEERARAVEEVAHSMADEVSDIGEDLDLASTLLQRTESGQVAERELHAIATIKREYLVMYSRTDAGTTTRVIAFDAPAGAAEIAEATSLVMLDAAEQHPGQLQVSTTFAAPGTQGAWYRVFARRPRSQGPAVAVVVDASLLLARMKLLREPIVKLVVLDAAGTAAPRGDMDLLASIDSFQPIISSARRGEEARSIVPSGVARRVNLPASPAVAIGVPLAIDSGPPWTLLVVASTTALQTQEQTLVRRVLVGSGLVFFLLLSAAAYVLHNTYRARTLRDRLRHADRLAHLTEKAEKILDHIPSGVLALSDAGRITSVNRWFAEQAPGELVGRSLREAFVGADPVDLEAVDALIAGAIETRQPQSIHRAQSGLLGREASLNIHAVPLARGIGDVSLLLVIDDVSELRRIEQRLLHSEKLVTAGQLAAGIAHEIGTPLNVARGRVELALSHLGAEHQEAGNHRVVLDQIDRVTRMLQQLLDYVRPAAAAKQQIDMAHMLQTVANLLAPQAAKSGVAIAIEGAPGAALYADPDQVQQIIVNLLLNAIFACEGGGRVILRTRVGGGNIVLEVEDNGHGIAPEHLKQVFDPFFTTKKRGQGTGLGLWVVAQLVRAQAAEIELDSTPGKGTRVRVQWSAA